MSDLNRVGLKKYLHWLKFCREIGWSRKAMPRLADLWLELHDQNGDPLSRDCGHPQTLETT